MVHKSIMHVGNKLNGQRKITIVDPLENSDEVQAELNVLAMAADCLAKLDDDGENIVDDFGGEMRQGFQSQAYDESMVLGLMGMLSMILPEDDIEE
jgi:hypothetical protein